MIEQALLNKGIKCFTMHGKDSAKKKYIKWSTFQDSKNINVFVGQIESGGVGIELFKTNTAAKYQNMFFYENVLPPISRCKE